MLPQPRDIPGDLQSGVIPYFNCDLLLLKAMEHCPWLQREQPRDGTRQVSTCSAQDTGTGGALFPPLHHCCPSQESHTDKPGQMLLSWSTFWLAAPACPCSCCGLCSHQGHGDCVGVFNFIVPTQWRKCNTDTALCLGCPVYTCASTSVLLQVTFQLGFFLTPHPFQLLPPSRP